MTARQLAAYITALPPEEQDHHQVVIMNDLGGFEPVLEVWQVTDDPGGDFLVLCD